MIAILKDPNRYYGKEEDKRILVALKVSDPHAHQSNPSSCRYAIRLPTKFIQGCGMFNSRFIFLKEKLIE